jgi:hypothetical protein
MGCDCNSGFAVTKIEFPDDAKEAIVTAGKKVSDCLGTGLFVVADPEAGPMELRKIAMHDISLKDASLRAMACVGAKWVPYEWISKPEMEGMLFPNDGCDSDSCGSIVVKSDGTQVRAGCKSGNCVCVNFPKQACA